MQDFAKESLALIDRVEFSGISIEGFKDLDELVRNGFVDVSDSRLSQTTLSGQEFKKLCIAEKGGLFDKFSVSRSFASKTMIVDSSYLSTTIKSPEGNLRCYTIAEYRKHLQKVKKHLLDVYGVKVDMSNLRLRSLEINKTFKLDDNFSNYHRAISLIMANLPHIMRTQNDWKVSGSAGIDYQTYYATTKRKLSGKGRCLELKIYNKSKQLENIITLTDSYMRIEFKLIGAEKIKSTFGTNRFGSLTDLMINKFFNDQIRKLMIIPYEKWKLKRDKELFQLMQEQRKVDIQHWQVNTLRLLEDREINEKKPCILDIEELVPLVKKLGLKPNRAYDARKNFRIQAHKYEKAFCNRDDLKVQEILNKASADATDMIPQIGGIIDVA